MYFVAPGKYVAITKVGDWFGDTIEIDVASQPAGPVHDGAHDRRPGRSARPATTTSRRILPFGSSDGSWIVGLSNNMFGPVDLSRYDPTFFSIRPV